MCQILIVEDEENIAAFIAKGFRKHGFTTTVVNDGDRALEASKTHTYDAILLDLGLPVKDGWAVLKELRDRGDLSPIIVITAYSDVRQAVLDAQANDYLQKPFRFTTLLATVKQQLKTLPSA